MRTAADKPARAGFSEAGTAAAAGEATPGRFFAAGTAAPARFIAAGTAAPATFFAAGRAAPARFIAAGAAVAAALLAAGAVSAGDLLGADGGRTAVVPRTALVIDADAGRDGRELLDPRLGEVDAEVRLPRTDAEARTDLRYLDAQDYRLVVAGPQAGAAATATGVAATRAADLGEALAAVDGR